MAFKKVLIISPYFPPVNAADMQRVRMSLPFFTEFGWEAEVVAVDPQYTEFVQDPLLVESIPPGIKIHYVKALPPGWTRKFGLGSIALRSWWGYKKKVDRLLKQKKFDLIYFSTTQFPVCALGTYWKKKHGIPFVIDMQDPWYAGSMEKTTRDARPPKFWFASRLNALLEPRAMNNVDGLISVSEKYLLALRKQYERCKSIPQQTITFGWFDRDHRIATGNKNIVPSVLPKKNNDIRIVYVGRGGADMSEALCMFFRTFNICSSERPELYNRIRFFFIGTSYAASGKGKPSIFPLAEKYGLGERVSESTDRIPFYQALNTLEDADALFVAGSDDSRYTASKIFPYIVSEKPLLSVFHPQSSVVSILKKLKVGTVLQLGESEKDTVEKTRNFFDQVLSGQAINSRPDPDVFENYSARSMTSKQCALFNEVVP